MAAEEKVKFAGLVPVEEFDKFREVFPQYGATNWFINTALVRFNQLVEDNPVLKNAVDEAIENMLDETLSRSTNDEVSTVPREVS